MAHPGPVLKHIEVPLPGPGRGVSCGAMLYLAIRVVHVLFGASWVGMTLSSVAYLIPVQKLLGPDAARLAPLVRSRAWIFPVVATLTLLSGFWLYWRRGFMGENGASHPAMAFGLGGLLGILAYVIGIAVVSRSLIRATALSTEATEAPAARKPELLALATAARARAEMATKIVAVLLVLTTILMAVGLYI